MGIDAIKAFGQIRNAAETVGSTATNGLKQAGKFISDKAPKNLPELKKPAIVDTFVKTVKKNTPEVIKNNKNAIIGGAIIIAAIASAGALIKSVVNKVQIAKNGYEYTKSTGEYNYHQG